MSSKEFDKLLKLTGDKLDRRIDWLNSTGYAFAYETAGRLQYEFSIKIGRNISEKITVRFTVKPDGDYVKSLEIVMGNK